MNQLVIGLVSAALVTAVGCSSKPPPAAPSPPAAAPQEAAPSPPPADKAPDASASLEARRKQMTALLDEQWQYTLKRSPELASILGDRRYNDQWTDSSTEAVMADLDEVKKFLARFEAIDTAGFPEQEALSQQLMVRRLKDRLDNARFENWLMP